METQTLTCKDCPNIDTETLCPPSCPGQFVDLWLVNYGWRDGENEYSSWDFVHADSEKDAEMLAEKDLSQYWGDETVHEDNRYSPPCGYPAVKIDSVRKINTVRDIIHAIGIMN